MIQNFVFSDETGHWNGEDYYIRSWIILTENDYFILKNKMELCKKMNSVKGEIKFGDGHDYSILENLNFKMYFTVSFCNDFKTRNFSMLNQINTQDDSNFIINGRNVREKILNT